MLEISDLIGIRSITMGVAWGDGSRETRSSEIIGFKETALAVASEHDISVRTCRLTLPPINSVHQFSKAKARSIVDWYSSLCEKAGVRWYCIPFCYFEDQTRNQGLADIALDVVQRRKNAFVNIIVVKDEKLNEFGVAEAVRIILSTSKLSGNGFDNFRVGVSCNVKPHTPFFPFSYHEGGDGFSIAIEVVDAFIHTVMECPQRGLGDLREELMDTLTVGLCQIEKVGKEIEGKTGVRYLGLDASLAPFPNGDCSVARLIELLGVDGLGSHSSLFFTAYLTNIVKSALKRSGVSNVGFNGVMYSVLEDDFLASQVKAKNITLDGLLAYSTVCGCGLDMVPVPGNVVNEEVYSLIMDVSAISMALKKPLGVRILPIPGKSANELTDFNYDFLVDTRVMEVRNSGCSPKVFEIGSPVRTFD